jgi:PAS domain S-box-containing protein
MIKKIKILHLEDNLNDAELIHEMLHAGGIDVDISVVNNKSDYLTNLSKEEFDIVLSDYSLPEFDGLKALVEAKTKRKEMPFIFVSGSIGEERAVQCLQLGAMDYVIKDRLDRLVPAVKRALRVVQEMRDKELAEEKLKQSENLFRSLVQNIHDAVTITDLDGERIFVNDYWYTLYEIPKTEDFKKFNVRHFIHPSSLDAVNKLFETLKKENSYPLTEYKIITYTKKEKDVEGVSKIIKLNGKRVMMNVLRDITQRKKMLEELAKIKLAIQNTGEAIFMTDADSKFIYVNPAFTEMYGWESAEIIGKETPRILKSSVHNEEFYIELWNDIKLQLPFRKEMVNKTKNGKLIEVKNMISSVIDSNNELIGYVSIQNDITQHKEQERVFAKAKAEAEEMNKLKSYFLSNISHEFRTPLISILGFSEMLISDLQEPEHKDSAKYIYDAGQRLQQTLNDILLLTDIEKKKIEAIPKRVNLNQFIKLNTIDHYKQAEQKNLLFRLTLEPKEVWINSDEELLRNILKNILDNSLKFTKNGGISVNTILQMDNGSTYAIIKIVDSGVGISKDKLEHIFKPFRQESEGLSRRHEGMGLGLSVAKQLVEILHGNISIKSEVNKGTLVTLRFPALPPEAELTSKVNLRKTTIIETPSDVKRDKLMVLMVEDNSGNRKLFRRYLENDFTVDEAEDGISGIAKAGLTHYDAIIMDINLGPGIDGVETFKRIRQLPSYKNVPVIAVTAFAMTDDKQKFLDEGFTDYLKKPLDKNELIAIIKKYIHK